MLAPASEAGLYSSISRAPFDTPGLISGTVAYDAALDFDGSYNPTILVADGHGGFTSTSFTWTINQAQVGPVLTNPGNQTNLRGDNVSLQLSATQADSNPLSWSASNLPPGLSIDPDTGLISGAVNPSATLGTAYAVTVTATDNATSLSASQSFNWTINATNVAPVLTSPGNQTNAAGDYVALQLSAADADGDGLTYTVTGLPAGLTLDPITGLISGTLPNSAASGTPYNITVTASEGMATSSQNFTWTVNYVNLQNPGGQSNLDGDSVSLQLAATDASGLSLTYSASGLPSGLSIGSTTGLISGTISNTADTGSPYAVTVTATDGSHSASQAFNWTVTRLAIKNPGNQQNQEGTAVSLQLSATDVPGTPTYSATGLPSGLSVNSSTGLISGTIGTAAHGSSPYQVTATATDGSKSSSQSFVWAVTPRVALVSPGNQGNATGDSVSLQLSATSPGGTMSYSANGLPSGLSVNSSTGLISGTIASGAASATPYIVTVSASDGTSTSSQVFLWSVSTIYLVSPSAQNNLDGDTVSLSMTVHYHGTGTLSYSVSGLPSGLSINSSTGQITGSITATADSGSPYQVTVTVTDHTNTTNQTFGWTVGPRVYMGPINNQSNSVGDTVSLPISASDATNATLSYSATGLPSGLTISSSTGVISGTIAVAADTGSPYTVTVTANDGTVSASQSFTWTVTHVSLTNPGTQTNREGSAVSLTVVAHDSDGDALTYSAAGLPSGLSINSSTGVISGSVAGTTHGSSPYTVTVTAADSTHNASQSFTWVVTPHVVVIPVAAQSNADSDTVSLGVTASDSDGDHLTYSASGLPSGLSINSSTGIISGTISSTADSGSPYTTTVTASDGTYSNSQSFSWAVSHVLVVNPGSQTNTDGDAVSLAISARANDHDTLTYSATGLPTGLSINSSTGLISGTISSTADASSPYAATVTASDSSHSNTQAFTWTVYQHILFTDPGSQSNADGDVVSLPISATDPDGDTLSYSATGLPSGLSINSSTGVISGTIANNADGSSPYTVTVTASDGSHSASDTFTWTVTHMGLNNPGTQTNSDGSTVSLQMSGRDVDHDTLTYSATGLPTGLSISSSSGLISGTIGNTDYTSSPYTVTVTATDTGSHSASQTFLWTVLHVGLANPGNQTNSEGDSVSLQLSATDPDGDVLSYSSSALPAGLTLNTSTGLISGTIAAGAATSSPYTITVSASDGTYNSSQTFTWTVNPYITLTNPGSQNNVEGNTVSLQIQATDKGGKTLTYSASNLPSGLSINSSTGLISGTVATGDSANNPYAVTVTAADGTYSSTQLFLWGITPASNQNPTITNPGNEGDAEGDVVALQISASDPDGDTLTYSATGLPDGLSIDPFSGVISGIIASTAVANGPYSASVTVDDGNGATASQSFTWTVHDAALSAQAVTVSATEGSPFAGVTVANFTDANANSQSGDFSATVNWGDSASGTGVVTGSGGSYSVTGSHLYSGVGPYTVSVTISDSGGSTATVSAAASMTTAALSASGVAVNAIAGTSVSTIVASFTDANTGDAASTYTATVSWGDGSTNSSGTVTGSLGSFVVAASHTYSATGSYTVTTTITDKDGTSTSTTSTATVSTVFAGATANLTASPFTLTGSNPTATINWGDGNSSSGTVSGSSGNWTVTGSHVYAQNGTYTATVTLTVSGGGSQTASSTVSVSRAALVLSVTAINASANFILTNATVATFTDANSQDTSSTYTATINWGDGTASSTGTITGSAGMFQVAGSHSYANSGDYPLTVTLSVSGTTVAAGVNVVDPAWFAVSLVGPIVVPSFSEYVYAMTLPPNTLQWWFAEGNWVTNDPSNIVTRRDFGVDTTVDAQGRTVVLDQWIRLRFAYQQAGTVTLQLQGANYINRRLNPPPLKIDVFKVVVGQLTATPSPHPSMPQGNPGPFRAGADNRNVPWQHYRGDDERFWQQQLNAFFPHAPIEPSMLINSADTSAISITTPIMIQPPASLSYNQYEVKLIQVGFIQTVTAYGLVYYGGLQIRRWMVKDRAQYGVDWLAGFPHDDPINNPFEGVATWPWYNVHIGAPGDRVAPGYKLSFADAPSFSFPEYYQGNPNGTRFKLVLGAYNFTLNVVAITSLSDAYNPTYSDASHYLVKSSYRDYIQGYAGWAVNWIASPSLNRPYAQISLDRNPLTATLTKRWHVPALPDRVLVNVVPGVLYLFYVPWPTWE